jgi:class 3 adenylate cyclase
VLLETIYGAFDTIAQRRGVFKIETIGDCYLACTGLPEPQAQHALIMARFAMACRSKFRSITKDLEMTLGPGTAELKLRAGIHSGSVTAGVLRGHKSRFQLFGGTSLCVPYETVQIQVP